MEIERKKKCYESHPVLRIGDSIIRGGSCVFTRGGSADGFIGLDVQMARGARSYPWTPGWEVCYPILDRQAPITAGVFRALIDWTNVRLLAGDAIYVGCYGGHGRTGLFLAALVRTMTGYRDAITYVRDHYCHKAVESQEQVDWLDKHYQITPVEPADNGLVDTILSGGAYGR